MLDNLSALAIVPKAKAMAARRPSHAEYLEFARKRSVLEVMAALQAHPYFVHSLKGISQTNLHREQLEQALSKDVFYKYEGLIHYSFKKSGFLSFFVMRCEIEELLTKLRLLSMGFKHHYIVNLPGFLADKTSFSLLGLAKAESAADCLPVLAGTPYAKLLAALVPKDGGRLDYLACEHTFWTYYYQTALARVGHGRDAAGTRRLFLMEAEAYNLDLLYRGKAFYADQLTPPRLARLLIPVTCVISEKKLRALALAPDLEAFLRLYGTCRAKDVYGARSADVGKASEIPAQRALYRAAQRLLHFSSNPETVLTAFLCLANMERSNVVNVIEGVRYGLPVEQIDAFLKY